MKAKKVLVILGCLLGVAIFVKTFPYFTWGDVIFTVQLAACSSIFAMLSALNLIGSRSRFRKASFMPCVGLLSLNLIVPAVFLMENGTLVALAQKDSSQPVKVKVIDSLESIYTSQKIMGQRVLMLDTGASNEFTVKCQVSSGSSGNVKLGVSEIRLSVSYKLDQAQVERISARELQEKLDDWEQRFDSRSLPEQICQSLNSIDIGTEAVSTRSLLNQLAQPPLGSLYKFTGGRFSIGVSPEE